MSTTTHTIPSPQQFALTEKTLRAQKTLEDALKQLRLWPDADWKNSEDPHASIFSLVKHGYACRHSISIHRRATIYCGFCVSFTWMKRDEPEMANSLMLECSDDAQWSIMRFMISSLEPPRSLRSWMKRHIGQNGLLINPTDVFTALFELFSAFLDTNPE